jgi:hypothetical protein
MLAATSKRRHSPRLIHSERIAEQTRRDYHHRTGLGSANQRERISIVNSIAHYLLPDGINSFFESAAEQPAR